MCALTEPEVIPQDGSPPGTSEVLADSGFIETSAMSFQHTPGKVLSQEAGLDVLSAVALNGSMYGPDEGYPPFPRLPVESLQRIREWIEDPAPSSPIMWLSGPPGVGKSVAAQKLAEIYRASNRFAASFFFHQGEGKDQGRALCATIAYQLANNLEPLRASINHIVSEDPSVFDKSLETQFQELIVQPFQESNSLHLPSYIVIIDGLDEFHEEKFQVQLLDIIAVGVAASKIPLRFLISSRPEPHIQHAFDSNPHIYFSKRVPFNDSISFKDAASAVPSQLMNSRTDSSSRPILRRLLPSKISKTLVGTRRQTGSLDSFPKLVTVQTGNGYAESYSRSLMMTGNGFPLWYPGGDLGKPTEYLQKGVSIGDVGTLDRDGIFDFCFNIFLHRDDPIHSRLVPREFHPIEPALDAFEVEFIPEYFKPGQVITSQGIAVTKTSENPLDISFSSVDREGGILILPNGGSRENLIRTARIHEYAKRNAPYWYQDVNGYGGVVHTNGSLFLVTGCDKANDWALASFPYYPGVKKHLDLQYTWQPDYDDPWIDNNTARTSFYAPSTSRPIPTDAGARHQCVFVRGMRISLSDKSWRETMPPSESARLFYTYILRTPSSFELLMNNILVYLRLRISEQSAVKRVTPSRLQLFHPNFVIGQELLKRSPKSDVALVDDSVWCSLTHESMCTVSEVNNLVTAVFDRNDVVEHDGIVTLEPKSGDGYGTIPKLPPPVAKHLWSTLPLLPKFLKQNPEKKDIHWVQDIPVSEHAKLF